MWPGQCRTTAGVSAQCPLVPCSSGHTASAPGQSPDTDLWDRGITMKPAVRTTQMVAQDDSRTNTQEHMLHILNDFTHTVHSHVLFKNRYIDISLNNDLKCFNFTV